MIRNLLIIGGQRCATGWISQCLREHPEIFVAPDETRFFDWNFEKGLEWYDKFFKDYNGEKIVGEKTANYLSDPNVPGRIYSVMPKAKLIVCLRNPIERFYSGFLMKSIYKPELKSLDFKDLIKKEPDLLNRGLYYQHLKRYFEFFDNDQIKLLLYDSKEKNPGKFIQSIYNFLGVEFNFNPLSLKMQTKPGSFENSNPILANIATKLLHNKSPFKKIYNYLRSNRKVNLFNLDERKYLVNFYREDIKKLEKKLNKDLSFWI